LRNIGFFGTGQKRPRAKLFWPVPKSLKT